MTLKVTTIGDQACVVLPPDVLVELGVQPGDNVELQRARASEALSEEEIQMQLAEQIMNEDKEVLRRLSE